MKYYSNGLNRFSYITENGFIQVVNRKSFSTVRAGHNKAMINDIETVDHECTAEEFNYQYELAASRTLEVLDV